jgi:hypothetical protein
MYSSIHPSIRVNIESSLLQVPDMLAILQSAQAWISNVTVQGDGQKNSYDDATRAITMPHDSSKLFAEGVVFAL